MNRPTGLAAMRSFRDSLHDVAVITAGVGGEAPAVSDRRKDGVNG